MTVSVEVLKGPQIVAVLADLARLRMRVFRDWPYLYDGTEAYEQTYLAKFAEGKGAVCIVARDGDEIVGASTASPMIETDDEFKAPFVAAGYDIAKVFYCGESVLLASHRGHGLGHRFFDEREAHARHLGGFNLATFCRVIRPDDHPLKPASYFALDSFWSKRGYAPAKGLIAHFPWKDVDRPEETQKPLQFWTKPL